MENKRKQFKSAHKQHTRSIEIARPDPEEYGVAMNDPRALQQLISRFRSRLAFGGAVQAALKALIWGAVAVLMLMLILKCAGFSKRVALISFAAIPVAVLAGGISGWRRSRCSPYSAAKQLDKHLQLNDRLANTFYFLSQDPAKRSPLAELAIADGLNTARNAKLGAFTAFRWTRRATYGVLASLLCAGWIFLLYPPSVIPAELAVAQDTQDEMKGIIKGLKDLPGVSAEQKDEIKKMLDTLNISEDDMNKMTRADLMRMISAKGIDYKGGTGKAAAFEAMKNAIGELDAIRQQRDEIEKKNKEAFQIQLANGQKITGVRISTSAPSEKIVCERIQSSIGIKQASESDELEQLQKQTALAAENAKTMRTKIGLKTSATTKVDENALLATNEKYQKDRDDAIKDPNSEAAVRVKKAQRDIIQGELDKGDIPAGTAEKLKNWMRLDK